MISKTDDWISGSVIRLIWPFLTCLSQICKGLLLHRNNLEMMIVIQNFMLPNRIQDWKKSRLICVAKHFSFLRQQWSLVILWSKCNGHVIETVHDERGHQVNINWGEYLVRFRFRGPGSIMNSRRFVSFALGFTTFLFCTVSTIQFHRNTIAMSRNTRIIALFDVDGTLTEPREVSTRIMAVTCLTTT